MLQYLLGALAVANDRGRPLAAGVKQLGILAKRRSVRMQAQVTKELEKILAQSSWSRRRPALEAKLELEVSYAVSEKIVSATAGSAFA